MANPIPPDNGSARLTWTRRYLQSTALALVICAFLFFLLLRDQISLEWRVAGGLAALALWHGFFLTCFLLPDRFPRLWSRAKTTVIALFVSWQMFFLIVRNPLDFWYTPIKGWCEEKKIWHGVKEVLDPVDDATRHYGNFAGIDQNWSMFVPPMARSASFLAARVEFTDGTEDLLRSDNEPDPLGYFRFGGWRQRKLEDYLVYKTPEELPGNDELPLWSAYARWSIKRWRERWPDDPRIPARVVLLRRVISFPEPSEDPSVYEEPAAYTVGVFHPDGSLAP
jgi:hypothetical protein